MHHHSHFHTPFFLSHFFCFGNTVHYVVFFLHYVQLNFITKAQIFLNVFLGHVQLCRFSVFSLFLKMILLETFFATLLKIDLLREGIESYFLKQQKLRLANVGLFFLPRLIAFRVGYCNYKISTTCA